MLCGAAKDEADVAAVHPAHSEVASIYSVKVCMLIESIVQS